MASKTLFQSIVGSFLPRTNAFNEAGGVAYRMSNKQALAQYASVGCLNGTFYASGEDQLATVLNLCHEVEPEFIAKTALYARTKGHMKDMPALLLAVLSVKGPGLLAEVFDRVIDSPKMLRNFVQIMRSGVVGRKSLGTLPKRLIVQWLESRTDEQLFVGSVGNDPSLEDIVKMVHPKPHTASRRALYAWLVGREYDEGSLPEIVQQYERIKQQTVRGKEPVPDVPFQMLTSLPLTEHDWRQIARNASWQMTRMNLNTFLRHGVFADYELVGVVTNRLKNPQLIEQARVFPYQLMAAYMNASSELPMAVSAALQDAMDIAISNVPHAAGKIYVCPDVSGSMHSPATGVRKGATTKVRCIDIAALVAAAVLRRNPQAEVIPFESNVVSCRLNPRDTVLTNAQKLASLPCGGTNCSAPLAYLNLRKAKGDLVIYVSDNESWIDTPAHGRFGGGATQTLKEWNAFKHRNPTAKMICIDIQPYATTQAADQADIINVGGFSDQVFSLIADVASGNFSEDHWVGQIERMRI
jgi:60 kDa SS-A/Ro ribonucleoprotein